MTRLLIVLILSFTLVQAAEADSIAQPMSYVVASESGPYYIKMIPGGVYGGQGIAYRLCADGSSREIWRVKGYFFEVFLSGDGVYLVRMGPWGGGFEPSKADLAVEFFRNGNLLRSYSTLDLVKDSSKVEPTISHYFWRAKDRGYPYLSLYNRFHLKTIDGITYQFDVTSGQIVDVKKN